MKLSCQWLRYREALAELRLTISRELWWGNINLKLVTQSLAKYQDKEATFRIATGIPAEEGGNERYAFPNGYSAQHLQVIIPYAPAASAAAAAVELLAAATGLAGVGI